MVYPRRVLEEIVKITEEYDLFIISDEIYSNIFYGSEDTAKISEIIGNVPAIAMKGISKELPWPAPAAAGLKFIIKTKILFLKNILNQLPTKNA